MLDIFKVNFLCQQAQKGFRPPSAIFVIWEIFWRIFWRIFSGEIFWQDFYRRNFGRFFFDRIFLVELFGRIFWEDIFGRIFMGGIFWEDFWGSFLGGIQQKVIWILKELICLSIFWFLSRFWVKERKEGKFKSLEVRLQVHRT